MKAGTRLAVKCSGSGVPVPEVRWRKGDTLLSVGSGSAELVLDIVTRIDIEDYVCEAFNGVGETDEEILKPDVLYAPEVKMTTPQISFQPKCGMQFQCLVHSSGIPLSNGSTMTLSCDP